MYYISVMFSEDTQMLTRIYMTYAKRPLQASVLMNSAAHKCQLFLTYKSSKESEVNYEAARRVFWSCYIMERLVV